MIVGAMTLVAIGSLVIIKPLRFCGQPSDRAARAEVRPSATPANLTAPFIVTQPVSQTVNSGGSVAFTLQATGSFPLHYQWRKDGIALSDATNAAFNLTNAHSGHAGNYTVVVSNATGSITSSPPAALTVSAPVPFVVFGRVTRFGAIEYHGPPQQRIPLVLVSTEPPSTELEPWLKGLSGVTAMAFGSCHTAALKSDGTVAYWGKDGWGQITIPTGLSGVSAIAACFDHTMALKINGAVVSWGQNQYGQPRVPRSLSGVKAIAAGHQHDLALKTDGTVVAWGSYKGGATNVPVGLKGVTAIAAGGFFSAALTKDGRVVVWGLNSSGVTNVPVAAQSGVTAIAAGYVHVVALKSDGTVVAWGAEENRKTFDFGQALVPKGLTGVTAIAAGSGHTVALKDDGTVVAWGDSRDINVPVGLSGVTGIAAGHNCSVAFIGKPKSAKP